MNDWLKSVWLLLLRDGVGIGEKNDFLDWTGGIEF